MSDGSVCPPDKWFLLRCVETAREPLGLKSTTLSVLRAMLSYMRVDQISDRAQDAHICFASNAALAERCHVSVQTIERHVARLVELGLIERVASANGKRWARRDRQGRVVLATGLSVLPVLYRHKELLNLAEQHADTMERIKVLRDRCLIALGQLRDTIGEHLKEMPIYRHATRLLRRKLNEDHLDMLLSDLNEHMSVEEKDNSVKLMGSDIKPEGHKEPKINTEVTQEIPNQPELTEAQINAAFPLLCAELRHARNQSHCTEIMHGLAKSIGISSLWPQMTSNGPLHSFIILGYVLERIHKLRSARAYATALLRDLESGQLKWADLARPKQPHRKTHAYV
ncbi:helix-turn-helix domain-containing protein [Sagittula sp. SSi028]|uniref:helix-turn-helix domain-containing protein n=1 Tax=Sagittula sp. SSi028 TaxID=3400636 RepID=UPI003AF7E1C3